MNQDHYPEEDQDWDVVLTPSSKRLGVQLSELLPYRHLILMLVRRDFSAVYKQTLLGPLWLVIQPIVKVAIFYLVFDRLAGISTDGVPPILFYLCGLTFWECFAANFKKNADTLLVNQHIFGKIYFPRMVMPVSTVLSNAVKLMPQFLLFLGVYVYYILTGFVRPTFHLVFLPFFLLAIHFLGVGSGLLISAWSAKYRDLRFLSEAAVQVLLLLSPVIYPLSIAENRIWQILGLNPMAPLLEGLRYMFFGRGLWLWGYLGYALIASIGLLYAGIHIFQIRSRDYIDTV